MDMLLALPSRERDQRAVHAALPAGATVRFLGRAADLRRPWLEGEPAALLIDLAVAEDRPSLERALGMFRQRAPTVPVCAYIPLRADMVRVVVHLALRRLVSDVIFVADDDLRVRLRHLLRPAQVRGEIAAVRHIWRRGTPSAVWRAVRRCPFAMRG